MTRFLLTLLALLTGLSATGGSVEARVCAVGGAQVGAVAALAGEGQVAVRQQGQRAPCAGRQAMPLRATGWAVHRTAIVPTVLIGPDRARE